MQVTNTLTTQYWSENPDPEIFTDRYGLLYDRLNIVGNASDLSLWARVDAMHFIDSDEPTFQDDARVERINGRYVIGDAKILVGDTYVQLGRGLHLALRKVDELGLDVGLRGGHIAYDGMNHGGEVFAGIANPTQLDVISQRFVEDQRDILAGGRYAYRGWEAAEIGALFLRMEPEEAVLPVRGRDDSTGGGAYIEVPDIGGFGALYAEVGTQRRTLAGETQTGNAAYVQSDVFFGDWVFLIEGLYLDEFETRGSRNTALNNRFIYNQPPTLERLDQEVLNNRDTLGGRLRVERFFMDGNLAIHANTMLRLNDFDTAAEVRQIHAFGGFELFYQEGRSRLNLSGGYRDEDQSGNQIKSMRHVEYDWLQVIDSTFSTHIFGDVQVRTIEDDGFVRGSTLFSLEVAGGGAFTFEFGYDTLDQRPRIDNLFYAGIVSWEFPYLLLRTTVGTQRGGLKCIDGICREFPQFSGAQLEAVFRYGTGG